MYLPPGACGVRRYIGDSLRCSSIARDRRLARSASRQPLFHISRLPTVRFGNPSPCAVYELTRYALTSLSYLVRFREPAIALTPWLARSAVSAPAKACASATCRPSCAISMAKLPSLPVLSTTSTCAVKVFVLVLNGK
jgi:hypothetical protein